MIQVGITEVLEGHHGSVASYGNNVAGQDNNLRLPINLLTPEDAGDDRLDQPLTGEDVVEWIAQSPWETSATWKNKYPRGAGFNSSGSHPWFRVGSTADTRLSMSSALETQWIEKEVSKRR